MHLYSLVDIGWLLFCLNAATYGMVAVWAFGSRWNWFVRTMLAGAAVAALLLIDDTKLFIQYVVAVAAFVCGLTLWRGWRTRRLNSADQAERGRLLPRISLRGLMLLTVVIACALAVAIKAPPLKTHQYLFALMDGLVIAAVGLTSAWLVLSRARPRVRFMAALPLLFLCLYVVELWFRRFNFRGNLSVYGSVDRAWQAWAKTFTARFWMPRFETNWVAASAACFVLFATWLWLVNLSGWLRWPYRIRSDPATPTARRGTPRLGTISLAVAALSIALAAMPVYLFALFTVPPPLSAGVLSLHPTYRALESVGKSLLDKNAGNPAIWRNASNTQYLALLTKCDADINQLDRVIEQGITFPWKVAEKVDLDFRALASIQYLMEKRMTAGDGTPAIEPRIAASLATLRLAQMDSRSSGDNTATFLELEIRAAEALWNLRDDLTAAQCLEVIHELSKIDREREPWNEFFDRSRLIAQNSGWTIHLNYMLTKLFVYPVPLENMSMDRVCALATRFAMCELAIRAYQENAGKLPDSLVELVPEYLPFVPNDPYDDKPLRYRRTETEYLLYSVACNGIDDGGELSPQFWEKDSSPAELFKPRSVTTAAPPAKNSEVKADAIATEKEVENL